MKVPKITVAIPTYQREGVLVNTIKDVLSQDFDGFELIVVDQTKEHKESTDRSLENINDQRFRYFKVSPPSLPAARNFAIEKSRSDIILFIDDDVQLSDNFISAHYNTHNSRPEIMAVAGRVASKGQKPSEELFSFNWYGEEQHAFNFPHPQEATSFIGCNFSIKKEIVKKVGGFDTNFCESSMREESEFASRIVKAGYKIWYEPKAQLLHLVANTGGCRIYEMKKNNQSFYKNDLYFTLKNVRLFILPFVLAAKFKRYVVGRPFEKIPGRCRLFLQGLIYGTKRRLRPLEIISSVVENK